MNVSSLNSKFTQYFNRPPQASFFAPGRVNLMGEHTDYNQGFVLSAAINLGCYLSVAVRSDQSMNLVAEAFPDEPRSWQSSALIVHNNEFDWSNYLRLLNEHFVSQFGPIKGMDVYIVSDLPVGAGLSSLFAVLVAFSEAVSQLNKFNLSPLVIAQLCLKINHKLSPPVAQLSEPLTITSGLADHALLIDCQSDTIKTVALPADIAFLVVDLKQPKGFVVSAFLQRKVQCETAAKALNVSSLRELAKPDLLAARETLDNLVFLRALHVVTENERSLKLAQLLFKNDMARISQVLAESQRSLKEDLDVTTERIDFISRELQSILGKDGGVHLTGGGFGGSLLVLLRASNVEAVKQKVTALFSTSLEPKPTVLSVTIGGGVRRLEAESIG